MLVIRTAELLSGTDSGDYFNLCEIMLFSLQNYYYEKNFDDSLKILLVLVCSQDTNIQENNFHLSVTFCVVLYICFGSMKLLLNIDT